MASDQRDDALKTSRVRDARPRGGRPPRPVVVAVHVAQRRHGVQSGRSQLAVGLRGGRSFGRDGTRHRRGRRVRLVVARRQVEQLRNRGAGDRRVRRLVVVAGNLVARRVSRGRRLEDLVGPHVVRARPVRLDEHRRRLGHERRVLRDRGLRQRDQRGGLVARQVLLVLVGGPRREALDRRRRHGDGARRPHVHGSSIGQSAQLRRRVRRGGSEARGRRLRHVFIRGVEQRGGAAL
mmetsp:Transcript_26573/g.81718  ORF Transcript_26573/g.81718 Transcript_26573/m.81718 type:complete len:236 (+) Transcript_26573:789-1496(+)